ncbi:chromosomal replication initiator protein DnaA [Gammaproteobacteria bacterium]|nr:chromosomal replication initiator protein DnaA [Gammaproteobacteria bacterium]
MADSPIDDLWQFCLQKLKCQISENDFKILIQTLQTNVHQQVFQIYAPNPIVCEAVEQHHLSDIKGIIQSHPLGKQIQKVQLEVGSLEQNTAPKANVKNPAKPHANTRLNKRFQFKHFIPGPSNQMALLAAKQVGNNPGTYNPFVIYGNVGLGKTHIMQAIGHLMLKQNPGMRVVYIHAETFVSDMVQSLQKRSMDKFKKMYREADALLIDDIQFLADKKRTQEEFFYTINTLVDRKQQMVLTSDCYPKELPGLEDRLKSRFNWGLTVGIEAPELETRVAILLDKAKSFKVKLPEEVAFLIAKTLRNNVRELEGALRRVMVDAELRQEEITLSFAEHALRDVLSVQAKIVTIDNIQRTVANYFKMRVSDLSSKRRTRSIMRPRQIAIKICKELTSKSYPEIGEYFGGRDHSTIIHSCQKIDELMKFDPELKRTVQDLIEMIERG